MTTASRTFASSVRTALPRSTPTAAVRIASKSIPARVPAVAQPLDRTPRNNATVRGLAGAGTHGRNGQHGPGLAESNGHRTSSYSPRYMNSDTSPSAASTASQTTPCASGFAPTNGSAQLLMAATQESWKFHAGRGRTGAATSTLLSPRYSPPRRLTLPLSAPGSSAGPRGGAMPSTRIAFSPRLSFSRPSVDEMSWPESSRTRSRR